MRRASYLTLCILPLFVAPLTAIRALRIPGVHHAIGLVLFGVMTYAARRLARPEPGSTDGAAALRAQGGTAWLAPTGIVALLWVGLATPWHSTPAENQMRYTVLLVGAVCVTLGSFLVKEALGEAGERFLASSALGASVLSGAAYVVWTSFQIGDFALRIAKQELSPSVAAMNNVFDALLFAAGALAYLASALFAQSLRRAGWLGRGAARAYSAVSFAALALLMLRGASFPDPGSGGAPWYATPGFVVGIPALPWFVSYFLGAVLLRGPRPMREKAEGV